VSDDPVVVRDLLHGRVLHDSARVVVVDKPADVLSEDVARGLGKKLVHRLDRGTSGCLLLADDARAVQRLQKLREAGGLRRVYRFVAHGVVDDDVTLTSTLQRDRGDGLRGTRLAGHSSDDDDDDDGATAVMKVRRLWVGERDGVVVSGGEAELITGRTHQVRIQLAEAGHVLVGERVYGRDRIAQGLQLVTSSRLMLHAFRLAFVHPHTRVDVVVEAPLPAGFASIDAGA
jgi:23S rRNA pseudouridine1911/1915/1917 synthase